MGDVAASISVRVLKVKPITRLFSLQAIVVSLYQHYGIILRLT
jgi:hypothetical protein